MQTSKLRPDQISDFPSRHKIAENGVPKKGHVRDRIASAENGLPDPLILLDRAYADLLTATQHLDAGGDLHQQMLRGLRALQVVNDALRSKTPCNDDRQHRRRRAPKSLRPSGAA